MQLNLLSTLTAIVDEVDVEELSKSADSDHCDFFKGVIEGRELVSSITDAHQDSELMSMCWTTATHF